MRDSWAEVTLGDIATIVPGKYLPKTEYVEDGDYFVFGSNSIMGKYSKFLIEPPHTVMAAIGAYAGAVRYSHQPSWVNNNAFGLLVKPSVLPEYFYLWLNSMLDLSTVVAGTGQPYVQRPSLSATKLGLPPLSEQKRIIDVMASVDAYIAALRQLQKEARTARDAVLHELLESIAVAPKRKLKSLTSKIGSGATPRGGEAVYTSSGVTLIRSQNVHDGRFLHEGLVAVGETAAKVLEGVSVEGNDVLINITGASVARACIVDQNVLPARVNQHVSILRTDRSQLLPEFLLQILLGKKMKSFLLGISGSGTTRQAITKAQLEDLEVLVPQLDEQKRIVGLVSSIDSVVRSTELALTDAQRVRTGLLSDLLSGDHEIPEAYDRMLGAA
jgi:restriction endonuclease S subunit